MYQLCRWVHNSVFMTQWATTFPIHLAKGFIYLMQMSVINTWNVKATEPNRLINHRVGVTGTGILNFLYTDYKKQTVNDTDGTNEKKQHTQQSGTSSHSSLHTEEKINHCMRGKGIKRQSRNETERETGINMHTHFTKLVCVCVRVQDQQRQTQQWVILAHCSHQTRTDGNSWNTSTHTSTHWSSITLALCWPNCQSEYKTIMWLSTWMLIWCVQVQLVNKSPVRSVLDTFLNFRICLKHLITVKVFKLFLFKRLKNKPTKNTELFILVTITYQNPSNV